MRKALNCDWPSFTDSDVNAEKLLLVVGGVVETLLVDDGVDGDGGFASLNTEWSHLVNVTIINKFVTIFSEFVTRFGRIRTKASGSGHSYLTITDDQLTLATADGHQRVDGLNTGLREENTK